MAVYAALYRAWRPHRLAEVVGQEHVTRTLRNALRQGRAAHAYLFCGPRGTGKTSTARIFAAALNCERPGDGDACGECRRCREIAADRLVDVQEIDAASHRQVDDMRALRETVGYAPAAGRHKVYILDEVHMLTEASWNTLLKTLEEPPPATSFVLCTTDPRKVLSTVVSRCQRFDFRRLTSAQIAGRLAEVCAAEHIAAGPGALEAIARRAEGGLRDGLSILDQLSAYTSDAPITPEDVARVVGAADDQAVERLLRASETGDARSLFLEVETLYGEGRDMAQVARDLLGGLRDRLRTLVDEPGASGAGGRIQWHLNAIAALAGAEGQMRRWSQPRLVLEVALLHLLPAGPTTTAAAEGDGGAARAGRPAASAPVTSGTNASDARDGRPGPFPQRRSAEPPGGTGRDAALTAPPSASAAPAQAAPTSAAVAQAAPSAQMARAAPEWADVLDIIAAEDTRARGMLQPARFEGCSAGVLRLRFAGEAQARVAQKWKPAIERAWRASSGEAVLVEYAVGGVAGGDAPSPATPAVLAGEQAPRPAGTKRAAVPARPAGKAAPGRTASDPDAAFRHALTLFEGSPLPENAGASN